MRKRSQQWGSCSNWQHSLPCLPSVIYTQALNPKPWCTLHHSIQTLFLQLPLTGMVHVVINPWYGFLDMFSLQWLFIASIGADYKHGLSNLCRVAGVHPSSPMTSLQPRHCVALSALHTTNDWNFLSALLQCWSQCSRCVLAKANSSDSAT